MLVMMQVQHVLQVVQVLSVVGQFAIASNVNCSTCSST